jgi:glycyl-tRNA synthetase beta chain
LPEPPVEMGELLLELLSEEIPARMQRRAIEDLTGLLRDKLVAADIPAAELRGYVTPRRLAIVAAGIPATQPDRTEERRGPRVGAPPAAIDGFLRSAGLGLVDECEIRDTGRAEFYFAVLKRSGRPAAEVLPELIKAAIVELPWAKSMRWPGSPLRWVRPLTSVLCLYDGDVLPLALEGVPVGRTTRGHRFMAPGEITLESAGDYLEKLEAAYVILDQDRRKEIIRVDLDRRAAELEVAVKPDPALLDEVAGLAEFPVMLSGAIDPDFMTLPPEVLQTAMRVHQKYFTCAYPDGRPAPHFLFVANNLSEDDGKAIIAGNERVLRARLADARFFWDQDRKIRLEDRVEALKDRVYHAKLGSMYDKSERMEQLAEFLADRIRYPDNPFVAPAEAGVQSLPLARTGGDRSSLALGSRFCGNDDEGGLSARARRAARLAKADLSTGMVGEFPELQGIMGRYYALNDDEELPVADAVAEHYKPLGPSDTCPTAPASVVVALADKIDALVVFFAIGERPTGSGDPFALRRAALGVIRIVLENHLRLSLRQAFIQTDTSLGGILPEIVEEILAFLVDRLKVHLRQYGFRHDLIAAGFSGAGKRETEDDLMRLHDRVFALGNFIYSENGNNLLTAYRRALSILNIEERRDARTYDGEPDSSRFVASEEKTLAEALIVVGADVQQCLAEENFDTAMSFLAGLRQPVDEFFDKVTVNTNEPRLRENRLRLLSRIRSTMNQVADFSLIEG